MENNSFLEAIQNGIPDEVDDNPYENAIKEQQKSEIYSASESAAKKNPDQHGKVTSLAQALGVKSDFAEQNYDSLMKRREAALLKQKLDDNKLDKPKTVEYVSDPDNLALTKDELDKYFKLEDKVQETSTWSDLGKGLMADITTGIMGKEMPIHEFVFDGFMVIVLGAFGIASVDKFINKRKGNE